MPVSPHGFGPYPEIPVGFRAVEVWPLKLDRELLLRLEIELFKKGYEVKGWTWGGDDGKMYPIIKGMIYIEWDDEPEIIERVFYVFGRIRISGMLGHPDDCMRVRTKKKARFERGVDRELFMFDVPRDIKIVEMKEAGLDPYQFLGLTPP